MGVLDDLPEADDRMKHPLLVANEVQQKRIADLENALSLLYGSVMTLTLHTASGVSFEVAYYIPKEIRERVAAVLGLVA